jgi:hypothetical protein
MKNSSLDIMNNDFEYGVDSRYRNKKERESDSIALMQSRLERMKNVSKEQIVRAKLLQLKLQMEKFLKDPTYDNVNHFTNFLERYVDAIYLKRSDFAKDINVTPVFLSQIVNKHREPNEEFILKLMIHSEKVFKDVCNFQSKTWYQVYFQEKISETMTRQEQWRPKIEKQVKLSELVEK